MVFGYLATLHKSVWAVLLNILEDLCLSGCPGFITSCLSVCGFSFLSCGLNGKGFLLTNQQQVLGITALPASCVGLHAASR